MSRLKKLYAATTSRLAMTLGAMGLKREVTLKTTRKVAKGKPFGHYIDYIKSPAGPWGQTHAFLHATKGWRVYSRIPQALLVQRTARPEEPEPRQKQRPIGIAGTGSGSPRRARSYRAARRNLKRSLRHALRRRAA